MTDEVDKRFICLLLFLDGRTRVPANMRYLNVPPAPDRSCEWRPIREAHRPGNRLPQALYTAIVNICQHMVCKKFLGKHPSPVRSRGQRWPGRSLQGPLDHGDDGGLPPRPIECGKGSR